MIYRPVRIKDRELVDGSLHARCHLLFDADVDLEADRRPAFLRDLRRHVEGPLLDDVRGDYFPALLRPPECTLPPHPGTGTGNENYFSFKSTHNRCLPGHRSFLCNIVEVETR